MITFSQLGSHGRFGNQLFQFAALKSLSIEKKYEINLPILNRREWHGQKCLLDYLSIKENQVETLPIKHRFTEKNGYEYDIDFLNILDDSDLFGFFQHKKYFESHLDVLKSDFKVKNNTALGKFEEYSKYRQNQKITSVHIRLGDLIDNPHYSNTLLQKDQVEFIKKSLELKTGYDFLIFTGGSRSKSGQSQDDIRRIKSFFGQFSGNFIFSEDNDTLTDFSLMTMCDSHILSPLSTFSLWVGYLSNGEVVVNSDYFLSTNSIDSGSLYLDNWITL